MDRRQFLKAGALGAAAIAGGAGGAVSAPSVRTGRRPNVLLVITDQQGLDTISALGCTHAHTPAMDRLASRGVSFMGSHSTNPLCSPARSSIFTGRPTLETGVVVNNLSIRDSIPNLGQWLGQGGYESTYVGKWHVSQSFPSAIPGFTVIPAGLGGQGELGDSAISRACEGYLRNRSHQKPFFLVASFLQPHDVCQFVTMHTDGIDKLPFEGIEGELPPLPANHQFDPREPDKVKRSRKVAWSELTWRYYLWSYYRMVEMVDAEIGRVLDALDGSGQAENTLVVFTADHGEGRGRHQMVTKNYLYDEAVKVPLIVSFPGRAREGARDLSHLVSGLDVVPTACDYAGVKPPPQHRGRSLRGLMEGKSPDWASFLAAEVQRTGRMIRTERYKYVTYQGDPVEQLFDMQQDPGETRNLADQSQRAGVLEDHRKMLRDWEARLEVAPGATL
jgi:arylsulfatase A-like enzyme